MIGGQAGDLINITLALWALGGGCALERFFNFGFFLCLNIIFSVSA